MLLFSCAGRDGFLATTTARRAHRGPGHSEGRAVYRKIQNCSSDMLPSAHLREALWQTMGPNYLKQDPANRDAASALILKYNPLVVHANGKFVTKAALQDALASQTVVAKAAGVSQGNNSEKQAIDKAWRETARNFASLSSADQDVIVYGESRFQAMTKILRAGGAPQARAVYS